MCSGQDDTNSFRLILTNLTMQSGMVYSELYGIRPVLYSDRKCDQFLIKMCPICIGIDGDIFLSLGIFPFYMA